MATRTVGIILNGATSRIGSTQHLKNALAPIRAEGGLAVGADRVMPRVLLVGRNADRLAALAREHGVEGFSTDLDAALSDPAYEVLFDAAVTHQRQATLEKAIAAGKHVYSEKPVATTVAEGRALLAAMNARGLKHAAVEDKQYLPGLRKLAALAQAGFFGRVVGFKLEFGWWVFDGFEERCQRPSWNYRKAGGGGLILDMYSHFRYVIESMLGPIRRVVSATATTAPERVDEAGERYAVDVEDQAADARRAAVRRHRLHRRVVGDAGAARRSPDLPGRRHPRLGGRRAASLLCAVDRRHAEGRRVQPRGRPRHRLSCPLAGGAGGGVLSQSLPHRMGGLLAPPRRRHAAAFRLRRRHPRCRLRAGVPPQPRQRRLGRVRRRAGATSMSNPIAAPTALVTGTSTGIGRVIALALARAGYDLAVTEIEAERLRDLLDEPDLQGRKVVPVALDLASPESIASAFEQAAAALSHIDLLVNNAGRALIKPAIEVTRAEWDALMSVNLTGTFFLTQQFGRHAIARRSGCVVTIASTHGMTGIAGRAVYGIAKAGLIQMTRMLAIEWAAHNVRANAIAPATVLTPSRADMLSAPEARARMLARIPSGRFVTPEEVAAAVVYLASPEAASITGQVLAIDGGLTAQ